MKISNILALFQNSRRAQLDNQFQTAIIIGYFIGGMFLTRIVSGVLLLILAFTLMRRKRILAVVTAHATTFLFCAVGLWAMLSKPRDKFSVPTSGGSMQYTESSEYPFMNLFIYAICIVIWFLIDFALIKLIESRKKRNDTPRKAVFGTPRKIQ